MQPQSLFDNQQPAYMATTPSKRLGVSLNLDTGYNKGKKGNEVSPPQTPDSYGSRTASANIPAASPALTAQTGPRQTFLDDLTPVDQLPNKENGKDSKLRNRDSHGLSLSPRNVTRDSLVDHMLLSLDQFSFSHIDFGQRNPTVEEEQSYSAFQEDEEPYQTTQNFAPRANSRGAGHTYTYSSDYDNADDSSRYSDHISRGRRSNSSSNFQSGLSRMKSARRDTANSLNFAGGQWGPPIQIPPRKSHSRSGKGSKGSSANSFDLGYAQITSNQRWAHGLQGRSSSFDYGSDRQSFTAHAHPLGGRINPSVTSFTPYDYEAAPTPTIPGGPRRLRPVSPIMMAQYEPPGASEPSEGKLERKRSTRSSKSAYKGRSNTGSGSRFDYGLHDRNQELPALPAFNKEDPAPAPLVGYGKAKEAQSTAQQPKERPGFFRRVFGSSKIVSMPPEPPPSHGSTTSAETTDCLSSKPHHIGNQLKSQTPTPSPSAKEKEHVLTKKPSSFFRRRKKSVSEPEISVPIPAVPLLLPVQKELSLPQPSPVSSLRKVMNPYLRSPKGVEHSHTQSTLGSQVSDAADIDERDIRGFSPEYTPDKNATIRAVRSKSREDIDSFPSYEKPLQHSNSGAPAAVEAHARDGCDVTFLKDSSDNGDAQGPENSAPAPPVIDTNENKSSSKMPSFSPTESAVRDMALHAEYERVHPRHSATALARASSPALNSPQSATVSKASQSKTKVDDEEWLVVTSTKSHPTLPVKDHRVRLGSSASEEIAGTQLPLASKEKASARSSMARSSGTSTVNVYKPTTPILQIEGEEEDVRSSPRLLTAAEAIRELNEPEPEVDMTPTEGERQKAQKIYDGNEDFIQKEKAAAWMGEEGLVRSRTLLAYMELYDFTNLNILAALRSLCGRLVLRAESQQVDRILDAFANRWCQCNPDHGFKVTDVVHTICYSILLLNTDLYLADIDQKMTRSQFIKNTMPTIRRSVADSAPDAFEPNRPTILPGKSPTFENATSSAKQNGDTTRTQRASIEIERPSWRTSFKPAPRADSDSHGGNAPTPLDYDTPVDDCGPLVKTPFHGTMRTWEVQVEIVLKDFYNSIRNERLPLFGAPIEKPQLQSSNSLAVFASGVLRRSPSVLSKAPSETQSYIRARTADNSRLGTGKFSNKNRSRPRLYPNSGMGSSRTSLDDQSSMWSPSVSSSTWSKYSLGKTQTSMSVDSLGSAWPQGDYQQSIGFANALSQAIIREETHTSGSGGDQDRVAPLLEDESLELAGAPWAKEGILKHKHHLEALDKKAKDRNWSETFAVIEKGYMTLFSFSSKSLRQKSKSLSKATGNTVVGGGNWQENAENLGSFLLRQTIASALPSPGYSKTRPHVWALSLPTGAVHLFQVGTPDIVKEFVSTANYWSARLSNHPLVGGISNIEYGWSDAIVNNVLVSAINDAGRPSTSGTRGSMQGSLRSNSLDQGIVRGRLPGDRIYISDWTPPTQSMRASNLMEPDQLRTLTAYVTGIEEELQKHNQSRSPMLLAFTPRHPNSIKAMANWEKKSSYLLKEIVKFRTYIDTLHMAEAAKDRIYKERAALKAVMERNEEGSDDREDENTDSETEDESTLRP